MKVILLLVSALLLAACDAAPVPDSCYEKGSSCGCSKYRKSECGGTCCKWYVGEGCDCRY